MKDMHNRYAGMEHEVTLLDVKLNKDNTLDLTYKIETLETIEHLHIPRLVLPITNHSVSIDHKVIPYSTGAAEYYCADIGFGEMRLAPDDKGNEFTVTVVETKTKEMTLKEIEKKLGHKVKIVSK